MDDTHGTSSKKKKLTWSKRIFKLIPNKRLTVGRKARAASARRKKKAKSENYKKSRGQKSSNPIKVNDAKEMKRMRLHKKPREDSRKLRFDQLKNKSDIAGRVKGSTITSMVNDQMTKSLEPSNLNKNIDYLKKKAARSANAAGPGDRDRDAWGFNVPIRLSHTQNIDFSGTGGSNNANSRQKRKQILSSLLDSGNFLWFYLVEKQNYSIKTRFSIQRGNKGETEDEYDQDKSQNKRKVKFPLNKTDSNFYKSGKFYTSDDPRNASYYSKLDKNSPYSQTYDNRRVRGKVSTTNKVSENKAKNVKEHVQHQKAYRYQQKIQEQRFY